MLNHFDVNFDADRQREIGERFNRFGGRIENINQALVEADFELFASIFVNKRSAIDGVFFDFGRERHRSDNFRVMTTSGIHDLLDGGVKDFGIISPHSQTKNDFGAFFFSAWLAASGFPGRGGSAAGRTLARGSWLLFLLPP
jgi:hypothetical protein